jgi:hypothetical protein
MNLIQEGQKITLNIIKDDMLYELVCTIKAIKDDRLILELPPYFMRYIQFLDVGCCFTAKVFSKLGTIDFNTIVISSPLENSDDFEIQLDYNAVRFTPGEEIAIINAVEKLEISYNGKIISAKTFEISTEYLKFYCDTIFDFEESFDCKLILPDDYDTISFRATVIEIDPEYNKEYKVTYSNMNEYDRQNLLYYMYVYTNSMDTE